MDKIPYFNSYGGKLSLRGDIWANKTSLTLPLFIEVPVPKQEMEQSCICVVDVSILPLSENFYLILLLQVWYFLFSFYLKK